MPDVNVAHTRCGAMMSRGSKVRPGRSHRGSVHNLKLIASGQSEIGFTMADAALDALQGHDKFKNKVPLQALLVVGRAGPMATPRELARERTFGSA